MINVTLGGIKTQEEKPFPKLMENSQMITFFTSPNVGTIIFLKVAHDLYELGQYRTDFFPPAFTDYNEPVTLQNV